MLCCVIYACVYIYRSFTNLKEGHFGKLPLTKNHVCHSQQLDYTRISENCDQSMDFWQWMTATHLYSASTRLEIHWAGSLSSSTKGYPSRSENHVVGMLKTDLFRSNSMAFLLEKRKSEKYTWHAVQLSGCHLVNCRTRFSLPSWNQSHLGQHSTWHSWQQLQRHSECFWEHARPPWPAWIFPMTSFWEQMDGLTAEYHGKVMNYLLVVWWLFNPFLEKSTKKWLKRTSTNLSSCHKVFNRSAVSVIAMPGLPGVEQCWTNMARNPELPSYSWWFIHQRLLMKDPWI